MYEHHIYTVNRHCPSVNVKSCNSNYLCDASWTPNRLYTDWRSSSEGRKFLKGTFSNIWWEMCSQQPWWGTWLPSVRNAGVRQVQVQLLGEDVNKHRPQNGAVALTWLVTRGASKPRRLQECVGPSRRGAESEDLKVSPRSTDSPSQIRSEEPKLQQHTAAGGVLWPYGEAEG